jgi:tight adherence protein C
MLRQSEEMGTSLGDTLKIFADEMRTKRMLRAEEKALALPAKLTVPLILFIFPCLLGVLIMPAAYRVAQVFGGHQIQAPPPHQN